ncbi:MAG: hypothetical protein SGI89_03310 [bacterium]|nr:hypothetical protein [bacterium]
MAEIGIYTTITITMLSVAYPILLQVIARLDEKYASDHIVELFDEEREKKYFVIFLIFSIISVVIWSFKIEPIVQIEGINFLINNSASLLVITNTIILVVFFFLFLNKILIYYTPSKFIKYLIQEHNNDTSELKHFTALTDIFLLSIQKQNQSITHKISKFFYKSFEKEREKSINRPVEYPEAYYILVHKSVEELAILKNKRDYSLEYRTAGGFWLLGESKLYQISELTYSWLWQNILLAIEYEQDDLILHHWQTANQYFEYYLKNIQPECDFHERECKIKNSKIIEERNIERRRFLEFHFALGALLFYKNRVNCIRRIFNFTSSLPPKYELLPESMNEVFKLYYDFSDPYEMRHSWISKKYPFPQQSGLNSDAVIKKWISFYLAILFLRQYTIDPYLMDINPLEYPTIRKEKNRLIHGLDSFRRLVSDALNDRELMKNLELDFITEEWCLKNGKVYPVDFIDKLQQKL